MCIIFVQQVFSEDYAFKEPYPPSSNGPEAGAGPTEVRLTRMLISYVQFFFCFQFICSCKSLHHVFVYI